MADLTCRCVPANYTSVSRLVSGVQSSVNSVASRVTDLENEVTELDSRITSLESVNESPFVVIDNEAELDAALLTGRHLLLRGEGTGGEIEVTSMKNVPVPGTKVTGYGFKSGSANHFGKLKCNFSNPKPYGTPFPDVLFYMTASNLEFNGFEIEGLDANDLVNASYIPFMISPAHTLVDVNIHDIKARNIQNFIVKNGYQNATVTKGLRLERNRIDNVVGYAVHLRESIYDSVFRDNIITLRQDGDPVTFQNSQGFYIVSDINDVLIENNRIVNPGRMGMELTSVGYISGTLMPMERNRIVNNVITGAGSMGISATYGTYHIEGNIVDEAVSVGIESSNGSTLGENSRNTTCIIRGNTVRNISAATFSTGISCDQSVGDIVEGNRIENVSSDFTGAGNWGYARGIIVYRAKYAKISNNLFQSVNGTGIFLQPAGLSNTAIQAVIEGNTFRVNDADTRALYAVLAQGTAAVIRNNVAYEPVSGLAQAKFATQFISPAVVKPGFAYSADISTDTTFTDSNLVIQY
jgi:hypothetical protein